MSQPVQEQDIEKHIKDYISKRYFTPSVALQLLCSGVDEHTFFDLFKKRHPDLYFLTTEDLIGLSHEHYLKSVSLDKTLDKTFEFIDIQLKDYYNSIFNIYICFRFSIIHFISAKCTTIIVDRTIKANLPEQLILLLYYLFDTFYGIMINPTFPPSTKKVMIYNAVESFVLLYSKLYIFLRNPEITLQFNFDISNPSLVLLLDVMIYKYLDSIHKISSVIIDNYIMCVRHFFNRYISIFGTTYTRENYTLENIEKIDGGLVHLACYFLNLPNLSFILSNPGSSIPTEIIDGFNRKICIVKDSGNTIECTLKEVERINPKPDPTSISVIPVTIETEFNVMSQKTLDHAIQLVRGVTVQLNIKLPQFSKLNSEGETKIITSLTTALSRKYFVEFLYIFCKSVDQFVLKNSQQFETEKHDRLIFKSNFSECCCKVPDFVITTKSEIDKQNEVDKQAELLRIKTEALEAEARKEVERRNKFLRDKQFKEEQQKLREKQKQEREAAAAAAAASKQQQQALQDNVADDAALPKELTPKEQQEIEKLTIQRNTSFHTYIGNDFPKFSALIQSGQYQQAASMLNEIIPQKLRDKVPWTAANMEKLPKKVQEAYDKLLQSSAPVSVTVASPVAAVASSGAAVASSNSSNSKTKKQQAPRQQAPPQAPQQQAPPPQERPLVEKKSPKLISFEKYIASLCEGNGNQCFAFMFRCSLKQFFRITSVVSTLPDETLLTLMGLRVSDSASAGAPPIINYMNLQGSGHFLRALFVIALLNGLCRVENVRFSFVGRTFLQLLACHSSLPPDKCHELHIPTSTSDVDVHVIFNNDVNPELYQFFIISMFNLFLSIPPQNIHIHIGQRDNASWALFKTQPDHMYVSSSRGFHDTVKFSLNTEGKIVEVSDFSFKKENDFTGIFIFTKDTSPPPPPPPLHSTPPPLLPIFLNNPAASAPLLDEIDSPVSPRRDVSDSPVARLRLLNLTYSLDDGKLFFTNPDDFFSVQLKFEFPDGQSGFIECLRNFINILYSFLTNKYDFTSKTDYYFIHTSNLLKFLVRAIQMKGISLFQELKGTPVKPTIQFLYETIKREFVKELQKNVHMVGEIKPDIETTGLTLLNLFFNQETTGFNPLAFDYTDEYRQTPNDRNGAATRIGMLWHHEILSILTNEELRNHFNNSYIQSVLNETEGKTNLYGGVKQQRQKYTKKNRTNKNKNKKYSRKMNKLKQNRKKSLKYYKQNNRKVTKKYRPRV